MTLSSTSISSSGNRMMKSGISEGDGVHRGVAHVGVVAAGDVVDEFEEEGKEGDKRDDRDGHVQALGQQPHGEMVENSAQAVISAVKICQGEVGRFCRPRGTCLRPRLRRKPGRTRRAANQVHQLHVAEQHVQDVDSCEMSKLSGLPLDSSAYWSAC